MRAGPGGAHEIADLDTHHAPRWGAGPHLFGVTGGCVFPSGRAFPPATFIGPAGAKTSGKGRLLFHRKHRRTKMARLRRARSATPYLAFPVATTHCLAHAIDSDGIHRGIGGGRDRGGFRFRTARGAAEGAGEGEEFHRGASEGSGGREVRRGTDGDRSAIGGGHQAFWAGRQRGWRGRGLCHFHRWFDRDESARHWRGAADCGAVRGRHAAGGHGSLRVGSEV